MSKETIEDLQLNTLIGYTDKRGTAWHYRADLQAEAGMETNHFAGPVPMERAIQLLSYPLAESEITHNVITEDGVISLVDERRKGIIRTDTGAQFGIFSKTGYQIHEPAEWCIENVQLLLDGGLNIGSVVLLKGGAVAAMQAELEDTREAAEGVKHRPFLTAATSHDGSLATTYLTGTTVVVCDNTLSAALSEGGADKYKIRHSSNSLTKVGEMREKLGLIVEQVGDEFDAQVKALTSQHVSDSTWADFVKAYTNPKGTVDEGRSLTMANNKAAVLNRLWNYDERVTPWKNNAYGVLAAVNTAMHHEFNVKGATRPERNMLNMATGKWDDIDASTIKLLAKV